MGMADRICYVYGIVSPSLDVAGAPPGIDGAEVRVEGEDGIAALVSRIAAGDYGEGVLEERTSDLEWLAPRAAAHDRVLTWASDAGPVAPFPILSLYRDSSSVHSMLRERRQELSRALDRAAMGREYHLRVFRLDDELVAHIGELSPRVAELEETAARATPGQRYLLERKLESERRAELRRVCADIAREIHSTLKSKAHDSTLDPLPRRSTDGDAADGGSGTAILNAAYLVPNGALDDFRASLTTMMERREREGFRFAFTGPWPVYHFVREAADAE